MSSEFTLPFDDFIKRPGKEDRTCLIYYGGKSRDADWIISHFPPHSTFVDVFGGGGAVSFRKRPVATNIYNDIGNVANFFRTLRTYPDALYRALYFTGFSREEYERCRDNWERAMAKAQASENPDDWVEWARQWFTVINQGYTHEEKSDTWHIAKQVNSARALANHVDDLPRIADFLRSNVQIEHADFEYVVKTYDIGPSCLMYFDPPYSAETRYETGNYENEMKLEDHERLLKLLVNMKSQAVVSNYSSQLYEDYLAGWRRVTRTHKSAIQNSRSVGNRGDRTEVLWIKEAHHGLWHWQNTPAYVAGIQV